METTRQADSGYPEENAPEVVPEDAPPAGESTVRASARRDAADAARRAPSNDDGTATGNPAAAGERKAADDR